MAKSLFTPAPIEREHCPKCGGELTVKTGKYGLFLGCSHYPQCDFIKPLQQHKSKVLKVLDASCPKCGHPLVLRQGQYGMFIGCSHYPECDVIMHNDSAPDEALPACPQCQQGQLVARRGRAGKVFYGCDNFPRCRFSLSHKPVATPCPKCGFALSVAHSDTQLQCANRACNHIFEQEETDAKT
ncbi:topoisomerase DNA-binding C4 zinc finger domain-containing protein [Pasteurellaceae bacterium TAE3-ERU1]|nr:topoisomerase DNA-binding C4 zinc finger domain-containing protein [Pasteurellaceae bacterium TAE3-ERU1]